MPTYCYGDKQGNVVERVFPMGKAPRSITIDRCRFNRALYAEFKSVPASSSSWPMTCHASGVNPEQAGELRSLLRENGVPTDVTNDGDPVYRDKNHRKKALKVRGLVDRSSFN